MSKEQLLQSRCHRILKERGIYYQKTIVATRAGVPDTVACVGGLFIAFEFKSPTGRQSPLQKRVEDKIKKSGGKYFLVRDTEKFLQIINIIQERVRYE